MKKILVLLMLMACQPVLADDDEILSIEFDISAFQVGLENVKRSAAKAFMSRTWKVEKVTEQGVVGVIKEDIKAIIDTSALPKITIHYLKDFTYHKEAWLHNLKKDVLVFLIDCTSVPD